VLAGALTAAAEVVARTMTLVAWLLAAVMASAVVLAALHASRSNPFAAQVLDTARLICKPLPAFSGVHFLYGWH